LLQRTKDNRQYVEKLVRFLAEGMATSWRGLLLCSTKKGFCWPEPEPVLISCLPCNAAMHTHSKEGAVEFIRLCEKRKESDVLFLNCGCRWTFQIFTSTVTSVLLGKHFSRNV
jgi:hypothetical protein